LAGWWKQLGSLQPQALWIGHVVLHRVEALVAVQQPSRLDKLSRLALKALTLLAPAAAPTLPLLNERLHLGPQVLRRLLHQLEVEGLVQADADARWTLTPLGRNALEQEVHLRASQERRVFYFVQSDLPERSPHFLSLHNPACASWPASADWRFDAALLEACIRQPPEWKEQHRFPEEVQHVLGIETASGTRNRGSLRTAWQRVILDRPEHLVTAFALVAPETASEQLLGFAVRPEGWELAAKPLFRLGSAWRHVFPELAEEPPADAWRQAWRAWCKPRNLPGSESDPCRFQRQHDRLHVTAPRRLIERLRAAHSDVFKGETWLLAGKGRYRAAARVELMEARPAS
jgi:hypothetical protein